MIYAVIAVLGLTLIVILLIRKARLDYEMATRARLHHERRAAELARARENHPSGSDDD